MFYFSGWLLITVFELLMGGFAYYIIQPINSTFPDNTLQDVVPVVIGFCSIFTATFVLVNSQKDLLNTRRYFVIAQLTKIWVSLYILMALCLLARFQAILPIYVNSSFYPIVGGVMVYTYCCMPLLVGDCLYSIFKKNVNSKSDTIIETQKAHFE